MTSTQVQRTLVKSAPEIWAEVSDPAALARHLDPVGEIRITRAEPEQEVEWEADGARGTVLIKPSGWGTRVTLIMSREEEPEGDAAPAQTQAPAPSEGAGEPTYTEEPEALGTPDAVDGAEREPESEAALETAGAPEPTVAGEPEAVSESNVLDEPEDAFAPEGASGREGPEPQPADVSYAGPEPQPADVSYADSGPQSFSVGYAADEIAGQDSVASPAAGELDDPGQPEPSAMVPAQGLDLLPRRGFLARLLRRRRRTPTPASSAAADSFHGLAARSASVGPWPTASAEWVHQFPRREPDPEIAPALAEPEPSLEDMLGEHDVPPQAAPPRAALPEADDPALRGDEPPIDVAAADYAAGSAEQDAAAAKQDVAVGAYDPGSAEQDATSAEHEAGSAEQDATSAEHEAGSAEQDATSAEHEAGSAEQDATSAEHEAGSAEQDEAVLGAVLDRLGAAHHRPFSRA